MTKYNKRMFDKIRENLNSTKTSSGFRDMLRLKEGSTYVVRLVPNVENIDNTFYHYYNFGWNSVATGQYVSAVSPISVGERCPIDELRRKLYNGSEQDKELAKLLRRTEQWLVNCYVVQNKDDDETVGEVKILRYGKQLEKIITEAISGDDSDEFGAAVFDLSEDGCNFKIKVDTQAGYKNYTSSRFTGASAITGMTDEKMEQIYKQIHDLENVFQIKSYDDLQEMLDIHLLCKSAESPASTEDDDEDDLPWDPPAKPAAKKSAKKKAEPKVEKKEEDTDSIQEDIDELLEGIGLDD